MLNVSSRSEFRLLTSTLRSACYGGRVGGYEEILRALPSYQTYLPPLMATIKPFAALRPKAELAAQICELPYDVMSSDEARQIAAGNPLSFLHVSKPEIDLPAGTDPYSPQVYAKGKENFERLIAQRS